MTLYFINDKGNDFWSKNLPKEVFHITRQKGTESPFSSPLYTNNQNGIYICVCCKQELFISKWKFDSKTGWPSFFDCIKDNLVLKDDNDLMMHRIEALCSSCGSHLGHVFDDGPKPSGKRYCINGLSLQFKPK